MWLSTGLNPNPHPMHHTHWKPFLISCWVSWKHLQWHKKQWLFSHIFRYTSKYNTYCCLLGVFWAVESSPPWPNPQVAYPVHLNKGHSWEGGRKEKGKTKKNKNTHFSKMCWWSCVHLSTSNNAFNASFSWIFHAFLLLIVNWVSFICFPCMKKPKSKTKSNPYIKSYYCTRWQQPQNTVNNPNNNQP